MGTLLQALSHLEGGEWDQAHKIVQEYETAHAYWLHGIVHLMEGDAENARYWYSRAKRAFSEDVQAELAAARAAVERD